MDDRRWRVGELAETAGLTVRTLHHYDEVGLLHPSERSGSGHRLYSGTDVRRLYRILAMRRLGWRLEEIARHLDSNGDDPRPLVRRHVEQLERHLELQTQLRDRLLGILRLLERSKDPSTEDFLQALEVMARMQRYYTPEQVEQLAQRRQKLGEIGMRKAEKDWADLISEVEAERANGTDPSDPKVQALVDRWNALIEAFTGGDPGIRQSLQNMYESEGPETASRGMVDPELMEYFGRAMEARGR